jgi:positive regulator of sigma E activity
MARHAQVTICAEYLPGLFLHEIQTRLTLFFFTHLAFWTSQRFTHADEHEHRQNHWVGGRRRHHHG